mmetsp:Transcript_41143/g.73988  ORF Transcript_41143/g.73988 Transcript_41143/m.73988 type:complete len:230 (-) Transcript_41143:153-842(-)|eukprot:CAMPEP_0168611768 /NCGR_PEP_ID=MMETSP0449_2-20121227/2537_1 /TAXON_ID=1082188 /ORGANISM="Strombidium rassoulzadegani, Strain ras09" /LENGTH=229 /DNA_ID=CAMNT_0008652243 /DNA_START=54 /DNA_END=743 /DNA_ORIENTATION=-
MLRVFASRAGQALAQQASAAVTVKAAPLMARSFAAEAAQAEVPVPIRLHGVSGRYATALYTASVKDKVLDSVATELEAILEELKSNPSTGAYMLDPTINKVSKAKTISATLTEAKYSPTMVKLMTAMAENGRMGEVFKVGDGFKQLVRAHRGQVSAVITSAQPLKPKQVDQVKKAVGSILKPGQKLELDMNVDPKILGGLIITMDDKRIDLSVSTRVKRMTDSIRTAFA